MLSYFPCKAPAGWRSWKVHALNPQPAPFISGTDWVNGTLCLFPSVHLQRVPPSASAPPHHKGLHSQSPSAKVQLSSLQLPWSQRTQEHFKGAAHDTVWEHSHCEAGQQAHPLTEVLLGSLTDTENKSLPKAATLNSFEIGVR